MDNPYKNGRTLLHFEGSGQKTKVFAYLTEVANHLGGYKEFKVDMTDSFNAFSKDNLFSDTYDNKFSVAACADNSRDVNMMPSDLSDFNLYGGL